MRVRWRQLQREVHQQLQGGKGRRGRGRQGDRRRHADHGRGGEVRSGVNCDNAAAVFSLSSLGFASL